MEAETGRTPPALANRVNPDPRFRMFWSAFWSLSGSRGASMGGAMPIPVSEVLAYCNLICLRDVGLRMSVLRIVQALDAVYLDHFRKGDDGKDATPRH